jgi:hypothetical protein
MFSSIKFSKHKGENIYDIRLPLSEKEKILKRYSLNFKYREKKFYIKNIVVIINPLGNFYNYEEDISVEVKDDFIIREYIQKECPYFSFFKSDIEEEYDLYSNEDKSVLVKEYDDFFTFEVFKDKKIV